MDYNTLMNIYFTASSVGAKDYLSSYKKIVDYIKNKQHDVRYKHVFEDVEHMRTARPKEERVNILKKLEDWIISADCLVVESSYPSISVGYEIYLALQLGKPTLLLYSSGDPPSIFDNSDNEKLVIEKYTPQTMQSILDDFLTFASNKNESRFTFFLTAEISRYLETVSKKQKVPKSVYLRQLILQDKKK